MSNFRIVTYDLTSKAYLLLKRTLGATGIKPHDSEYVYREGDYCLNWGLYGRRNFPLVMNQWEAVGNSCNKLRTFSKFAQYNVPHPQWTHDKAVAKRWIVQHGKVYARACADGCKGDGITVCTKMEQLPQYSMFYTLGFDILREYRVYVAYGQVIDIREKVKPRDMELDMDVRASDDWLYSVREAYQVPESLLTASKGAASATGLDFCGVDIALNKDGQVCVFEVNSAPWLGTITVNRLTDILKEKFQ